MNVVIDSYGLLGAIGQHRQVFGAIDSLVVKQATTLLTAQLKHKSLDLAIYRKVAAAIGADQFELFLDTVDDKLLKSLAKKLDAHAPVTKSGDGDELRPHLKNLADGRIEPSAKLGRSGGAGKKSAGKAGQDEAASESGPHAIATKPPGRR